MAALLRPTLLRPTLLIALAALLLHAVRRFEPLDSYAVPLWAAPPADAEVERHFSGSYLEARSLFRTRVAALGADVKLHTLPLPEPELRHLGLTIDAAVIPGAADRVLLHISGTHGVEGFAGSAVQSRVLELLANGSISGSSGQAKKRPTVVFVHALNPFGFALLRRFNEHNVDLNRNWLTPERFAARQAQDPNAYGYQDVHELLNPPTASDGADAWSFWPRAVKYLVTKGFDPIKRAVVSGNYHSPESIYFGGARREPSLELLEKFLRDHVKLAAVAKFGMIDVHTGLGAAGVDTLLMQRETNLELARSAFHGDVYADKVVHTDSSANDVSKGYDGTEGFVYDGIASLLPASTQKVLFAQEFGTVPGPFVLQAMTEEHALYRENSTRRMPAAERLRDVFYLHQSASWKHSVLERGVDVFEKLYAFLAA